MCVQGIIVGDKEFEEALITSTVGLFDEIMHSYDRYDCYNQKTRNELACEVAAAIVPGAALAATAGKKLLSKGLRKVAGTPEMSDALRSFRGDPRLLSAADRAALLSRNGSLTFPERVAEAQRLLGRSLSPRERGALREAHEIGLKQGRGYGTYTRVDLNHKARILREAGFKPHEIDGLMRHGLAGSSNGMKPGFLALRMARGPLTRGDQKWKNGEFASADEYVASIGSHHRDFLLRANQATDPKAGKMMIDRALARPGNWDVTEAATQAKRYGYFDDMDKGQFEVMFGDRNVRSLFPDGKWDATNLADFNSFHYMRNRLKLLKEMKRERGVFDDIPTSDIDSRIAEIDGYLRAFKPPLPE